MSDRRNVQPLHALWQPVS